MTAVSKVAIAGCGVAALAASIQLAKGGAEVRVFESKPNLTALGSGITLQGNALRVLGELGVWDAVRARGAELDGLVLRLPGPGAPVLQELPDFRTGGPDYPGAFGMYRPDLAEILLERAVELGVRVDFGSPVTGIAQTPDRVEVTVAGESVGRFDLLIGADGLNSAVRELVGIDVKPQPTGMGAWRAFVSRPAEVKTSELYYGGPVYIAGYTPTGADTMYAFLVEKAEDRAGISDDEATRVMLEESRAYQGPWDAIRTDLEQGAHAHYTWFTHHLVPAPWNRGRVVVIGDAAHSCPPTIAQGAAQALEDASVLAELLVGRDELDQSLWDDFHTRRLPRAEAVVRASVQLGQWQIDGDRDADAGGLISSVAQHMAALA
jgi:2-polyprenyl-6-methoxyphenol hydroxylase-like FAD-dependent oxidoreductase